MLSGVWGVAALSGPFHGGILAAAGAWRWAFWIDVPVAAMVWILAECSLPGSAGANGAGVVAQRRLRELDAVAKRIGEEGLDHLTLPAGDTADAKGVGDVDALGS